jgi:hypothetical protein
MRCPLIFPEAMACKAYCVNLGQFIDGECYLEDDLVLYVSSCVWEITVGGHSYSCHIKGEEYHFEREYRVKWLVGEGVPDGFSLLVEEAYEYDSYSYPKLRILTKTRIEGERS